MPRRKRALAAPAQQQQQTDNWDLAPELLQHVLRFVPLQQRLKSCALVCKAWAAAAASVEAQVDLEGASALRVQRLQPWLQACGDLVSSVSVQGKCSWQNPQNPLLELPCSRLTQLNTLFLNHVNVSLQAPRRRTRQHTSKARAMLGSSTAAAGAAAGTAGESPLLSRLQCVKLLGCRLQLPHLMQLCQRSLTHLTLGSLYIPARSSHLSHEELDEQLAGHVAQGLSQLTRLQELELYGLPLQIEHLSALSNMRDLLKLILVFDTEQQSGQLLQLLPERLTSLELCRCNIEVLPADLVAAARLNLQQLILEDLTLDPRVLACWGQHLTHLELTWVDLEQDLEAPEDDNHPEQADIAALQSLLSAVGSCVQLRYLEFSDVMCAFIEDAIVAQQQYSGLTASPHLTHLHMSVRNGAPLPRHALKQMLPAGRQLPQLRVLHLQGRPLLYNDPSSAECIGTPDIKAIAACCPGLTSLALLNVVRKQTSLKALVQLPNLVALTVAGAAFGTATAVRSITQLTGLQRLCAQKLQLPLSSLQQLTGLQRLTHLEYIGQFFANHTASHVVDGCVTNSLELVSDPQDASTPPVWQQLKTHLESVKRRA